MTRRLEILMRAAQELDRRIDNSPQATGCAYIRVDLNEGSIRGKPRISLETNMTDPPPQTDAA